jgi:hypothetical protein
MLEVRCSPEADERGEAEPTEDALLLPGGATPEELARLSPQHADEVYNEFDFTDPSATDPVTLSYGEPVLNHDGFDFEPIVQRAERFAESYYAFLQTMGETRSDAIRVIRREWFLASQDFATVHILFDRRSRTGPRFCGSTTPAIYKRLSEAADSRDPCGRAKSLLGY